MVPLFERPSSDFRHVFWFHKTGPKVVPCFYSCIIIQIGSLDSRTNIGPALRDQNWFQTSPLGHQKSGIISGPEIQQVWVLGVNKHPCQACTPAMSCECGPGAPWMATASARSRQSPVAMMQCHSARTALAHWWSREAGAPSGNNAVESALLPPPYECVLLQ